jgi:brefeldin A-inhibited guanine nucleotide-exchange protein
MDTERDAFVSSLVNLTGIYKVTDNESLLKKELSEKNIKCTQAILHLAKNEGNYLADSWKNILKCISMINYYHTIGSGSKGYAELFLEHENAHSRASDPETEAVKGHNAAHIIVSIDESEVDKVFSNSKLLGPLAIVDFMKAMCQVSIEELNKDEGPRIFLLQKLVEVTDSNMNRTRIEFSNMWREMKEHISSVGQHQNEQVALYAIDSLRQLAKKFLEKEELNNYHFQKNFLEPFNVIMLHNMPVRMNIIHFIMSCMCSFARQMTKNLRSGWEIIIEIFKFGGENDSYELSKESIETLNTIIDERSFTYIEEYFEKIVNCLVKFMNNKFEDHALIALDLLERVGSYLGENVEFFDRITEKSNITFTNSSEKYEYKKSLWKCILYELSKKSFEIRTSVTERSNQLMFDLLSRYNGRMHPKLWELIFQDLLKAMFDDLHIKLESKSTDAEMYNTYLKNTKTMVENLIRLINSMEQENFKLSVQILLRIFRNFSHDYPNSPVSIQMLEGMNNLSIHCEDRFDKDLWKTYINVT